MSKQKEGPFLVISRHEDDQNYLETRRTDYVAAKQDVDIIKTIFGRAAWIEDDEV